MVITSYTVADRDFVASEEEFILDPRRFNVTLTRARSKFVMFVTDAMVQHLLSDAAVATDAAHLQLFVENYCSLLLRRRRADHFAVPGTRPTNRNGVPLEG